VKDNKLVYSFPYGVSDIRTQEPITEVLLFFSLFLSLFEKKKN